MKKLIILFFLLFIIKAVNAQRITIPLNEGWYFIKGNESYGPTVNLPHTWNITDVMDDEPGYYRGIGIYKRKLPINKSLKGKELYLTFNAANQYTEVFINGKKAGEHTGGYTVFHINISPFIDWTKENELQVKVDNSHNRNIPPLTADFTFFGGLYRDVSLVAVNPVHFSFNELGSKGVFISTPTVSKEQASVHIYSVISNKNTGPEKITVRTTVYDPKGKKVGEASSKIIVIAGPNNIIKQQIDNIRRPILWSPGKPMLYKIVIKITSDKTGKTIDELTNPLAFRWFRFDANGFFLNDEPLKLVGASRHQDYKGLGNAVPAALARKDVQLLKKMGGNFLRVAHYPQDQSILDACDELGILASVEIPVVNEITESDSFYSNCKRMQVEMIRQNFNHPSVIIWCSMNEVLLRLPFNNDKARQKTYIQNVAALAKTLDSLTRAEDPSRYTMIAHHGDFNRYRDAGMNDIAMITGWNLYSGWYGAKLEELPAFLDRFHKEYPNQPLMVTEYGADADPRIRSTEPVRFDKSVEYATRFHQYYYKEIMQRPFVAGAMVWNLADFNSETRNETMPHINNKGLMEWDRTAKDPYFYYKAVLTKEPFIKILGDERRSGIADSGVDVCTQTIQVAGNTDAIQITVNGQLQEIKQIENGIAGWRIPFKSGANIIEAAATKNGKTVKNNITVAFTLQPDELNNKNVPLNQMNILLGAKRYFTGSDDLKWIPAKEYYPGSWGTIGGKSYKMPNNNRLPYGTDKNIFGTDNDPVYQTQQTGIQQFRFDVQPGTYELTLHFAELEAGESGLLPYNLNDSISKAKEVKRIFNVAVNDQPLLQNFNMLQQYGAAKPIIKKTTINITNNKGITISFTPVEGEAVLNAVQIRKSKYN